MTEPRLMPRPLVRYAILALLVACALWVRGTTAWSLIERLRNPSVYPDLPLSIQTATRTIGSGSLRGDQILAIDGRPFNASRQFEEAVYRRHPGDRIRLTLSKPDGTAFEREIVIPSQTGNFDSFSQLAVAFGGDIVIPLIALSLGAFAVALRPRDSNAWLLLCLMIGFSEVAGREYGLAPEFNTVWTTVWGESWSIFMMLFGIYFPGRAPFEKAHPWVKYLLLAPVAIVGAVLAAIVFIWHGDIDSALPFHTHIFPPDHRGDAGDRNLFREHLDEGVHGSFARFAPQTADSDVGLERQPVSNLPAGALVGHSRY
jgi:hypothetical protein